MGWSAGCSTGDESLSLNFSSITIQLIPGSCTAIEEQGVMEGIQDTLYALGFQHIHCYNVKPGRHGVVIR